MKITHIISTLNLGGAENFLVQLANTQAITNEVVIVILRASNTSHNYISKIDPKIKLITLDWHKKYSFRQLIALDRLLKKRQTDVIHVHLHNPLYYVYAMSCIRTGYNYVHTIHNSFTIWKPVLRLLNIFRFLNNRIIHVCVSHSIHEEVQLNFPKLKTVYVNNGIQPYKRLRNQKEIADFWNHYIPYTKTHCKFLVIANNSLFKNFDLLIDICNELQNKKVAAKCLVIGKTNKELLPERIPNNLFFAGAHNNAADFLIEADALWISSTEEGMPIVALEALSLGVPIISTPAGGMKDIVKNGFNGFISKDFTVTPFVNNVLTFLRLSEEERELLKCNAEESFSNTYTIDQIHQSYIEIYQSA